MQALAILFGAAFTAASCLALGALLLGESCSDAGARFVTGAAILSLLVFLICGAGLAYPPVFFATGAVGSPPACPAPALVEAGADAAPAIPAAAPPVATAPATIVAPSIFEMRMRWNLLSW